MLKTNRTRLLPQTASPKSGKIAAVLLSFLMGSGTFQSAWADDTEIFAGGAISGTSIPPNILFVLDNSGSMDNPSSTPGKTRMEALKQAFSDLMDTTHGISMNAGLLRFYNNDGSRNYYDNLLYYPVTDINTDLSADSQALNQRPELLSSTDDAYEDKDGAVYTEESSLKAGIETEFTISLPYTDHKFQWYSSAQNRNDIYIARHAMNAFRFENLNIPENATIEKATIEIEIETHNISQFLSSSMTLDIAFDDNIESLPLESGTNKISERSTTPPQSWQVGENHLGDGVFSSPNLSAQLQTLKGSSALDHLTLIMGEGSSTTTLFARKFINGNSSSPKLKITYSIPEDSANSYTAGLRFNNIAIPQGATILSASLNVISTQDFTDTPTFNIQAESNSPQPFQDSANNISNRTPGSAAQWTAQPWNRLTEIGGLQRHSINFTSAVSEAVNQSDWCGGDALTLIISPEASSTGIREFVSFDSSAPQPELDIEYSTTSGSTGCNNLTIRRTIQSGSDDAQYRYKSSSNKYTSINANRINLTKRESGFRFDLIPVKKDSTESMIEDVYLEFTASHDDSSPLRLIIKAENSVDAATFNENQNSVKGRSLIDEGTAVEWQVDTQWLKDETYRTPNLKGILPKVLDHDDWQPGNALALVVNSPDSDEGNRRIYSFDGSAGLAPKLVIKMSDQAFDNSANYKVRDALVTAVQSMSADGGTPAVARLLLAKDYLQGNHEGYNTPITNSCQSNNIIFLSDGLPNNLRKENIDAIRPLEDTTPKKCTYQKNSSDIYTDNQTCGVALTEWMKTNDLLPNPGDPDGDNTVTTYTIGFGVDVDGPAETFLTAIASPVNEAGDKHYYTANTTSALTDVFTNVLQEILSTESSFVSPSVSVNQYQSSRHLNALYYGLFTPSKRVNWNGNLKKYKLGVTYTTVDGEQVPEYHLIDSSTPPQNAVNDSGEFSEGTRSFWSPQADGGATHLGGAASRLPDPENRQVFTDVTLDDGDALSGSIVNNDNTDITATLLGIDDSQTTRRTQIINWARGIDSTTDNARQQMGDPLHSEPALVTYGCTSYLDDTDISLGCANDDSHDVSLFFGTNQGFLHAINGQNGVEHFAYIPQELLINLKSYWANPEISSTIPKPYGIDGNPVIWRIDRNDNGVIEPTTDASTSDKVYLYTGLRRGGSSYIALDVTERSTPKLLWKIDSSDSAFSELGQSWSTPALTSIIVNNTVKKVLVFGGGYDIANDVSDQIRTANSSGNALFIVDALTGDLLWKATNTAGTSDDPVTSGTHGLLVLDKMDYSIPGNVKVIDMNFDGVMEQIVFADMGGQVWRLFVDIDTSANSENSLVITPFGGTDTGDARGVVANLSDSTLAANNRRFYSGLVTGQTYAANRNLFTIGIGSGYRAHPLNETVNDRFYVLKSSAVHHNPSSVATLTEDNLYNATSNHAATGDNDQQATAQLQLALVPVNSSGERETDSEGNVLPPQQDGGWFIEMGFDGEKILSNTSLRDGWLSFVSYEPATAANSCNPVTGVNRLYRINASDGTGFEGERYVEIETPGIVSDSQFISIPNPDSSGDSIITQQLVGTQSFDTASSSTILIGGWIDEEFYPLPESVNDEDNSPGDGENSRGTGTQQ